MRMRALITSTPKRSAKSRNATRNRVEPPDGFDLPDGPDVPDDLEPPEGLEMPGEFDLLVGLDMLDTLNPLDGPEPPDELLAAAAGAGGWFAAWGTCASGSRATPPAGRSGARDS